MNKYYVKFLGYEAPFMEFETLKSARQFLRDMIQDDIDHYSQKLGKVKHSADHYETKIGGRQGYHTYSEGYVLEI